MNKRLSEAIPRVRELPDDRQEEAAVLLLDFLDHGEDYELTPEQIAEIEAALTDDERASDAEVAAFFAQTRK